VVSEHDGEGSF